MLKRLIWTSLIALSLTTTGSAVAQTIIAEPSLPGYILVVGNTTNRTKIGTYAAALPPIYASHNAYYLAIGGAGRGVTWLEGPWQDRSLILGRFLSRDDVDKFWWGDAYRAAIRKRDNAGVFSVVALQGVVPLPFEGVGAGYLIVITAPRDGTPDQLARAQRAASSLSKGVTASGGVLITSDAAGAFTSLEGDTPFSRYTIAAWSSIAARDSYVASGAGRTAARLRRGLGLSVVASANGVPRTQAPPAATQAATQP